VLIALIGILGIFLGGFLNASFSFLLARRAERRETKTAARLVLPELLENRERLESALEAKRWRHIDFRTGRWRQHELSIASGFGPEWGLLATVYTALMLLNDDRRYYEADEEIEFEDDLGYMQLAAENLDDAVRILQKWAGVQKEVLMLPGAGAVLT
jgi:hypothetical protein